MISFLELIKTTSISNINEARDNNFDLHEILPKPDDPSLNHQLYDIMVKLIDGHVFAYSKGARSYQVVFNVRNDFVWQYLPLKSNGRYYVFKYKNSLGIPVTVRSTGKSLTKLRKGSRSNKGLDFEDAIIGEFRDYINGGQPSHLVSSILALIPGETVIDVRADGSNNTRRPLTINGDRVTMGNVKPPYNIGKVVSDITVITDKGEHYISTKSGPTISYGNIGIAKLMPERDIISGNLSKDAIAVLECVGINPKMFCAVFNTYNTDVEYHDEFVDVSKYVKDTGRVSDLLASIIGTGYILVHDNNVKYMSWEDLKRKVVVKKAVVRYPFGKKRVECRLSLVDGTNIMIVFRNTSSRVYPNKILLQPF